MAIYRVAVDGNEANVQSRVGSNIYAHELLLALEKLLARDRDWSITILLTSHPLADMPAARSGWQYILVRPRQLWTQWALPKFLHAHQHEFDLFFTPGHYAPRHAPIPYISAVLDLAFLSHPQLFTLRDRLQLTYWTKYSVKHAASIITISQASKQEIMTNYQVAPDRIAICHPAVGKAEKASIEHIDQILKKFVLSKPYFIALGTIQPRKNLTRLVEAFESFSRKQQGLAKQASFQQYHLVLAGKEGWLARPILQRIAQSPFAAYIHITGFVTEGEKWALLRGATASVTVGLKEGFGIPALEALEVGTIPVVANATSLPEVVGDAGILVDPTNVLAIADGLWRVATLKARERAIFRKRGREQRTRFSWLNTAQNVRTLWQTVLLKPA
ncbi:MAG: hypothetical protein A2632_00885 [Candidatus Pacebacteria bacterium RIFCSPHIGHO2_01_FULL_46_16]|nr:MAG: hypothetical protein A2632_00885 [Candidatus Pacebacteria bacterium RIFCSPHIGHO2_01_FULL_46_16]